MVDYLKYEIIKTKKIINSNIKVINSMAFKAQEDAVNNVIEYLMGQNFEIIEITHDNVCITNSSYQYIYTITDITYGKLKNPKK